MKKIILLLALLVSVTLCFAEDKHVQIANDSTALETHERHKEQKVHILEYKVWRYNEWMDIPAGWHVVSITANDTVVIIVMEKN